LEDVSTPSSLILRRELLPCRIYPSIIIIMSEMLMPSRMTDRYPNNPEKLAEAKKMLRFRARDNTRTPMQWDYTANAGFCPEGVKPWMRVNDDYKKVNAAVQYYNEDSVYGLWKKLIALRKEKKDVFVYGYFEIIDYDNTEVVSYRRYGVKESYVVVLNFTQNEVKWDGLGDLKVKEWLIGNYAASKPNPPVEGGIKLRPWEGLIGICNHPEKD
jgi:oligo-1,6-glucosidase